MGYFMSKSVVSKETVALQKQLADAYRKDMKAMVGKTFMITTLLGGDEDDEGGVVQQEFVYVEKFDEDDGLIGTTVFTDEDSADISIGTVIDLGGGDIIACSKNEFAEALKRAQRRIEKKLEGLKGDQKNGQ